MANEPDADPIDWRALLATTLVRLEESYRLLRETAPLVPNEGRPDSEPANPTKPRDG